MYSWSASTFSATIRLYLSACVHISCSCLKHMELEEGLLKKLFVVHSRDRLKLSYIYMSPKNRDL